MDLMNVVSTDSSYLEHFSYIILFKYIELLFLCSNDVIIISFFYFNKFLLIID